MVDYGTSDKLVAFDHIVSGIVSASMGIGFGS